jgi:hypothetical protein
MTMRFVLKSASVIAAIGCWATPLLAADLDGPVYEERDRVVIERPAPRVIERERIIERYYDAPGQEVYVAPSYYAHRVYAPYAYNYYDGYRASRPAYFLARPHWWYGHRYRQW